MKRIFLSLLLPLIMLVADAVADSPKIYTSICNDPGGMQTFYLQETIVAGRHASLEVAKVDMLAGEGIDRLLVFSATSEGILERDAYLTADLKLVFSSDAQQYNLLEKADITLGTQGETGPIIEGFQFHHQDGRILDIVAPPQTLECRTA